MNRLFEILDSLGYTVDYLEQFEFLLGTIVVGLGLAAIVWGLAKVLALFFDIIKGV